LDSNSLGVIGSNPIFDAPVRFVQIEDILDAKVEPAKEFVESFPPRHKRAKSGATVDARVYP
jgi:hypothetical protein